MSSEGQADSPILVSYAGPDFMWAEWISEQLQRAGCAVDALESSGGPTTDLAETLRQAADGYRHCIAVLSSNYFRTAVPTPEAGETAAAWAAEHPGVLIPVLVRRCELPARFWPLSPADLREVSDDRTAARRLLSRVLGSRAPAPEAIFEPMTRFPGRRPAVWSPDLPARNPFFTGRDEMLRNLRRHLTTDVTALVPHSLQGLAGIGKTQLAVEYAYRFAADYDVVWWIPAGKQATARRALADLAVRLDLGGPQTEISELLARGIFGLFIARQEDALLGAPNSPAFRHAVHPAGAVIQHELRHVAGRFAALLADAEAQTRRLFAFVETQRLVDLHGRECRKLQQSGEDGIAFAVREGDSLHFTELGEPVEAAAGFETRDGATGQHQSGGEKKLRLIELHALGAAAEEAGDGPLVAIVLAEFEPGNPRIARIPGGGLQAAGSVIAVAEAAGR